MACRLFGSYGFPPPRRDFPYLIRLNPNRDHAAFYDWLDEDEAQGEYVNFWLHNRQYVCFTDENTAFVYKMRFG